jgi:6-phosphofructokinase 2
MALELVRSGGAEVVALTLGARGAVLASANGALRLASPEVDTKSAVGAGDAFLGAMVGALARGEPLDQAFALGVAAGAATAASAGAGLATRAEIERLLPQVAAKLERQQA